MFSVDAAKGEIEMNVGDTGAFLCAGERDDGVDFTEDDRAVFTIKDATGEIRIERIYHLDDDDGLGNGVFLVEFHNDDTDHLDPGQYSWEVRFVVNPYYDSEGKIVNGDIVWTPGIDGNGNPIPMTLKAVQADI